jgi:hypothetical protein
MNPPSVIARFCSARELDALGVSLQQPEAKIAAITKQAA